MSAIPELGPLLDTSLAQALGWALLQFIWQGALVGVLTAIVLSFLQRSDADVRYLISTIAMSLMLTLPVVTVIQELSGPRQSSPGPPVPLMTELDKPNVAPVASVDRLSTSAGQPDSVVPTTQFALAAMQPNRFTAWLVLCWMLGVVVLTVRLVSGWCWIQRLRIHGRPAASSLCEVADRVARRLHITRAVRLVESPAVDVPTVMGWLKPVILIPMSALGGLSPAQLEAVLAHELAHVRRHDYLVNLLQTIVETLLFYHPAVWWVSRQIRIERENCCDDLAVRLCGDRVLYAQALADLEQLRGSADRLALAANGGSLVHRVRRLLGAPSHAGTTPGWLALALAVAVIVSIAGIAARAMDRDTAKSLAQNSDGGRAQSAEPPVTRAEQLDVLKRAIAASEGAPQPSDRMLREFTREFAQTVRHGHRALNALLHDLLPQVPPLPPLPPTPPEPPLPPDPPSPVHVQEPPMLPDLPDAAVPPEPPLPIDVPVPPEPVAPPAPPPLPFMQSKKSGNFVHSNNGEKLEVSYRGDIEFTDDDSDVKSISPDGWLRIKETGRNGTHAVEFRADSAGKIERRYWSGTSERPFDPEGRKWLAEILPRFIRQTAIGAEARVRRIYKTKGAQGVFGEIALIEGSWAKRIYFVELLEIPGLDARTVQQALERAGKEVDSDFELASLLISTDQLLSDDATRKAYIDAARSIDSDFEMRRVYSSAVKGGPLSPAVLTALLESATAIGSDFEQASLLIDVAKLQSLSDATPNSFFKAVASIESDFEQRRVLSAVADRPGLSPAILGALLQSATGIGSNHELATLLLDVVKENSIEGALREPFFKAVDTLESDFERGRVLQAAAKRGGASEQTVLEILKSAGKMKSDFEAARVLLTVAGAHPLSSTARDAYVDAADRLGEYEQGRVLSALVKNERRK